MQTKCKVNVKQMQIQNLGQVAERPYFCSELIHLMSNQIKKLKTYETSNVSDGSCAHECAAGECPEWTEQREPSEFTRKWPSRDGQRQSQRED
jgi:hypothetical protein